MNGDTLLDLVSGDRSGYVNYFRRLPNGELTTEPRITANGSTIYYPLNSAPHLVDWNEDGLLDLLLANSDQSTVRIRLYLNSGTATEYLFTGYTELTGGGSPISLSRCNPNVVDLNNDLKKDLVCGEDLGRIFYYENTGTNEDPVLAAGVQLTAEGVPIRWPSGYTDLKVWCNDWNEDGTQDMVVGNYDDSVHLYLAYPLTGVEELEPTALSPLQASPNPFAGHTTLRCHVAEPGPLAVTVYDVQGRRVRTLYRGTRGAGTCELRWDRRDDAGRRVEAGTYFARLNSAGTTGTEKLTVGQ